MKKLRTIPMRRAITAFLCGLMVFYTVACSYYKVAYVPPTAVSPIVAEQGKRLLFLHNGSDIFRIESLSIEPDNTIKMQLNLVRVPISIRPRRAENTLQVPTLWDTVYSAEPLYYAGAGKKRYNSDKEKNIVKEVHFYLQQTENGLGPGLVQLPASAFREVHVLSKDVGKSIFATLGTISIIYVTVGLIVLLTKSSCPYVYVFDGDQFIFQGEIFSGATFPNMERHDYLPLPQIQPVKGEYRLRIANELKEQQFVNLAGLQAIRHPEGTQALFDINGAPQLIAAPQLPQIATSTSGNDAGELMAQKDGQAFLFDEEQAEKNSLTLQFENRPGAAHPKLVLSAKNSLWFDHLVGRYLEKWGDTYPQWTARQAAMSHEQRLEQNIRQDFYLSAFVKDAGGQWQLAGRFPLAGPLGWRDMVLPLDPAMLQGKTVDIRLETGYCFWEVDYAAMDFSENNGMEIVTLPVKSAKDQDGKSQLKALAGDDDLYLRQLSTDDYTEMRFKAIAPPKGRTQTLFLHTKGYYEHVRDFQGEPKMDELEHFRQPHYFDQFSKEEYRRAPMVIRMESN